MVPIMPVQSSSKKYFDVYPKNRAAPPATSRPIVNNQISRDDPMMSPRHTEAPLLEAKPTTVTVQSPALSEESSPTTLTEEPNITTLNEDYIPKAKHPPSPLITAHLGKKADKSTDTVKAHHLPKARKLVLLAVVVVLAVSGTLYFMHV
jgi:hypothetical protein